MFEFDIVLLLIRFSGKHCSIFVTYCNNVPLESVSLEESETAGNTHIKHVNHGTTSPLTCLPQSFNTGIYYIYIYI